MGQESNRLKKQSRKRNSDIRRLRYKDIALIHIDQECFSEISEYLQVTLIAKLLSQFIELNETQIFQKPENLT